MKGTNKFTYLTIIICTVISMTWYLYSQIGSGGGGVTSHVHDPIYASLFEDDPTCAITTINTGAIGTLTGWTTASISSSNGMVVDLSDPAGSSITLPATGFYGVAFAANFDGTNNAEIIISATNNGVKSQASAYGKISAGGDIISSGHPATVWPLTSGTKIRLELGSTAGFASVDVCHLSLVVVKAGSIVSM